MKVEQMGVEAAAGLLLNKQLWEDVKTFVRDVDGQTGLSGTEKHAKVRADLCIVFGDIGENLLNLAINLAVAWLKTEQAK